MSMYSFPSSKAPANLGSLLRKVSTSCLLGQKSAVVLNLEEFPHEAGNNLR